MSTLKESKSFSQSMTEWKEFFWNPRTHEFMGRTAGSWALILLFYLIFYGFLTGLFCLTMWVLLQTVDDYRPKYQDRVANPGTTFRDWSCLLGFLRDCSKVATVRGTGRLIGRSSIFNLVCYTFHKVSRRTYTHCGVSYRHQIIGLLPGAGIAPYVTCEGKRFKLGLNQWKDDSSKLHELAYFPQNGTFDLMYFPYYGKKAHVNYTQPLVAVKFLNITYNVDINVECKIHANNIKNNDDRDKFAGRVSFILRINKD
nr:PREDICTED: sodium/potassium-transporting ATPase subunit beta-2 [Latimeria chalumnae]|eukprot:XP_014345074.1 PREDICTED: sodium/potassium-transporting ATPase subunit beta-2 [Latimeria chalumnae]